MICLLELFCDWIGCWGGGLKVVWVGGGFEMGFVFWYIVGGLDGVWLGDLVGVYGCCGGGWLLYCVSCWDVVVFWIWWVWRLLRVVVFEILEVV